MVRNRSFRPQDSEGHSKNNMACARQDYLSSGDFSLRSGTDQITTIPRTSLLDGIFELKVMHKSAQLKTIAHEPSSFFLDIPTPPISMTANFQTTTTSHLHSRIPTYDRSKTTGRSYRRLQILFPYYHVSIYPHSTVPIHPSGRSLDHFLL